MLFNRFAKEARLVVEDAIEVARQRGAPTVEAEHMLLAIARSDSPAARALAEEGLDYDGLSDALSAETTRSLAAVGVAAGAPDFSPFIARPRFATSAKVALERALRAAVGRGDKHIGSRHVALGALRAPTGTVPRALECANVNRAALLTRLETL